MRPNLIILLISAFTASIACAQYNPTVNVDGTYKPEIIDRDRINTFPDLPRLQIAPTSLQFDLKSVRAGFSPSGIPMQALEWEPESKPKKGWVHAELGSWLNARLIAAYKFVDNNSTSAWIRFDHNSTSLWHPDTKFAAATERKREVYDERLQLGLTHKAQGYGRLSAHIDYNFANYNYYNVLESNPFQNFNNAALRLDWNGDSHSGFKIDANAGFRYTGFRDMYLPFFIIYDTPAASGKNLSRLSGERDMSVTLGTDLSLALRSETNRIGINISGELIITGGLKGSEVSDKCAPENFGMLTAEPYYRYETDIMRLIAGARMDFPVNTMSGNGMRDIYALFPASKRGRDFYISPDVRFDYGKGCAGIEIHITGGANLYTLSTAHERDFYCQPGTWNTLPEFTPLNASAAFRFGPFAGFQFRIAGSYRIRKQLRNGGWYTLFLNNGIFDDSDNIWPYSMTVPADNTIDIAGTSVGVGISYEYGPEFRVCAEGTWQPQRGNNKYFNGYDMPEFTTSATIESNPWRTLRFALRYDLRALRHPLVDNSLYDEALHVPLSNWSNLCFNIGYDIFKNFTIGVRLDNILNRKQAIMYQLPMPGFSASGTLTYVF